MYTKPCNVALHQKMADCMCLLLPNDLCNYRQEQPQYLYIGKQLCPLPQKNCIDCEPFLDFLRSHQRSTHNTLFFVLSHSLLCDFKYFVQNF